MTLPELAIRRPVTTLVTLITILVIGGIALTRLPLGFLPDAEPRRLFVSVDYPGASPKVIERMIVRPLEEALTSVPGLERSNSRVGEGNARIMLFFDWSTDLDIKRTEIRERVDRVMPELPDDIQRITISSSWNARESGDTILEARISSGHDLSKDYDLLERKIVRPLERINGVASVSLDGVNPREIKVNLKMEAMRRHNVDARTLMRVLSANNEDRSLGVIRDDERKLTLRSEGAFKTIKEISELPIPGTALHLKDLAEITYEEPPLTQGRHLDGAFAVGLSITKESSANTVEVCDAILAQVEEMSKDPELGGISFLVWQNQGSEIKKAISDLNQTGLFGALLACVILFLFLRRVSTTLISVACIPFALVVACGAIWTIGNTLNTLTLLGLIVGIGMLVDNSVVVIENIVRYQQKGYSNRVAALLGAREVSVAVIAATLTSVIVFLPIIFSKPSQIQIYMKELGMTICFTLLASLFVSQTLIPLATGKLSKRKGKIRKTPIMTFLQERYAAILNVTLNHRWLTILIGIAVFASLYYPATRLTFNFEVDSTDMFVSMAYRFSEDLPFRKKEEILSIVETELEKHKEEFQIKSIYSFWSDRFSLTRLYMNDGYTNEAHLNLVRRQIRSLLPEIAGVSLEVQDNQPHWRRNSGKRVGFQLMGPDTEVLTKIARVAKDRLETVPGLFDVYTSAEGGSVELQTRIDRDRAREYNVDPTISSEAVELTFRGRRLPRFKTPDGEVEMRLTLDEQEFQTRDMLQNLPIIKNNGETLQLDSFADFSVVRGPDSIERSDKNTNVWVGGRFDKGDKDELSASAKALLAEIELPIGYRWDFNPGRREAQETMRELIINLCLAMLLIFAVMAGLFESIRQAFSMMISLPFSAVGAAWGLYLTGTDFDIPAFVGLLLLLGIVVNNGIIMIEHINLYRRDGIPRREAMLRGCKERLRPILMTAFTTLVGLIPMAVQKPALGSVYYYSIAIVIMGGLLVSSILTALLLPATVCIVEDLMAKAIKPFVQMMGFTWKDEFRKKPAQAPVQAPDPA